MISPIRAADVLRRAQMFVVVPDKRPDGRAWLARGAKHSVPEGYPGRIGTGSGEPLAAAPRLLARCP